MVHVHLYVRKLPSSWYMSRSHHACWWKKRARRNTQHGGSRQPIGLEKPFTHQNAQKGKCFPTLLKATTSISLKLCKLFASRETCTTNNVLHVLLFCSQLYAWSVVRHQLTESDNSLPCSVLVCVYQLAADKTWGWSAQTLLVSQIVLRKELFERNIASTW